MNCKKCISTQNCKNYDEKKCEDCLIFENAVPVGMPLLPDYACFKCKYEKTCIVSDTQKI